MLVKINVAENYGVSEDTFWFLRCSEEQATVVGNSQWLKVTTIHDLEEMVPDWDISGEGIGAAFGIIASIISELENN